MTRQCEICKASYTSYDKKSKFCSRKCSSAPGSSHNKAVAKTKTGMKRAPFSTQWRKRLSKSLVGRKPWNNGLTKEIDRRVAKSAKKLSESTKGKTYLEIFGDPIKAAERAKVTSRWMKKRNIIHMPGAIEKMSKGKVAFYKEHPEKHANIILSKKGNISKPQKELLEVIRKLFLCGKSHQSSL